MRHFEFSFGVLVLCFALAGACWGQTAGSVTKYARGNPTIGIVKYTGDASARAALENMLAKCDWFQVLKTEQAERASVRLSVSATNGAYAANVATSGEGGKSFRAEGIGQDWNDSAARLTDAILKELFGVPAMCTRPIAYVVTSGGLKEIYTCRLDGSAQTRLTHNNALSSEPSWGHAGALVYTLNKNNALKIVLVDVANNRQRTISSARGLNASAALSASGRMVALPLSLGKQVDLYLVDLANGKPVRMTQDRDVESSPVFSPDGRQICFVSDKSGRPQLYLISVEGGEAKRLTSGASECVSPDWSPRSKLICCSTRVNGQYVIATLDPSKPGEKPVVVTEAAGQWEAPSWAPDGRHVVCTRSTGGFQDLYLVDTWFHTFLPLTKGAHLSLPAWAPAR